MSSEDTRDYFVKHTTNLCIDGRPRHTKGERALGKEV